MPRLDVNRSGEMEVFVRVVELGGFSAAARALRMTPSAVSKLVTRLETRLGARLLNRSTRQLQLTPEGCNFYERSQRVLADLDETEREASATATARGRVSINTSHTIGEHFLAPLLPDLLARHPHITLDIALTDAVVDLLENRTDIAIRAGPLKSSGLIARKLGQTRMVIAGSPAYLQRNGTPKRPQDLTHHNCLSFGYVRAMQGWPLLDDGTPVTITPVGNAQASDGEMLRRLALNGLGLARLAAFRVRDDIATGRLVPVLEDCNPGDVEEFHAVFLGHRGQMPARVRAVLDYLVERVRIE